MQQIQGEWAIIGVLGMVLFIVVIGKKIPMRLNFMIRIVLGGIGIFMQMIFLEKKIIRRFVTNGMCMICHIIS